MESLIVITDLINKIANKTVNIIGKTELTNHELEDEFCTLVMDANIKENYHSPCNVTSITPLDCYKCVGEDFVYYIVGKQSTKDTSIDNIYVYYQEGTEFNAMRIKYIIGDCKTNKSLAELIESLESFYTIK